MNEGRMEIIGLTKKVNDFLKEVSRLLRKSMDYWRTSMNYLQASMNRASMMPFRKLMPGGKFNFPTTDLAGLSDITVAASINLGLVKSEWSSQVVGIPMSPETTFLLVTTFDHE